MMLTARNVVTSAVQNSTQTNRESELREIINQQSKKITELEQRKENLIRQNEELILKLKKLSKGD